METVISSKGQAVIPKPIRDALGLTPGSRINIELDADGARLTVVTRKDGKPRDGYGMLHYEGPPIPEAEWKARIAEGLRRKHEGR